MIDATKKKNFNFNKYKYLNTINKIYQIKKVLNIMLIEHKQFEKCLIIDASHLSKGIFMI